MSQDATPKTDNVITFSADRPGSTLDRLMNEATNLAQDARDYLTRSQPAAPVRAKDPQAAVRRLEESVELGRITTRVSMATAWILARKAVNAGELSVAEGNEDKWRLGKSEACTPTDATEYWPQALDALSKRSINLYARIERLDQDLDRDTRPPQTS